MNNRLQLITKEDGFTLTELLVSAGLSLFVLASIGGVFRAQTHTVKGQESRMEAQEYAMTALDMMVREIRNTGYFPSTACDTNGGIVSASATALNVQYDKNGNGSCSGDDEVIAFVYDGASQNITRNTTQALTDGNVTAMQLIYYPQQTSATAPAPFCISTGVPSGCSGTLSTNLRNVQRIAISLTIAPRRNDADFTGASVTMTATADLRNHGN
jgi:Tfp pilus assembly protein PilW